MNGAYQKKNVYLISPSIDIKFDIRDNNIKNMNPTMRLSPQSYKWFKV